MFYTLEPEVAGGLGPSTEIDRSSHPPIVTKLHYELDGWLGDELLESFPCFIVTEGMKDLIETAAPSGCTFDKVKITKSQQFKDLYPNRKLPPFFWMKVTGKAGLDDFGISSTYSLVVSERLLHVMRGGELNNCTIQEFED